MLLAVVGFSCGISWFLVYQLGWHASILPGFSSVQSGKAMSFFIFALLIGAGFALAAAPVLMLSRVYKRQAGPDGDTGHAPL